VNLKVAAFCSLIIHLGFLSFRPPEGMVPQRGTLQAIEISYIPAGNSLQANFSPGRVKPAPPKQGRGTAISQKPAAPKQAAAPKPVVKLPKKKRQVAASMKRKAEVSTEPVLPPTAGHTPASGGFLPAGELAAFEHKEQVREHLRAHLRYPAFWVQGTVRLQVVLDPKGKLRSAKVTEASDPRLRKAALAGMRSAAPYPVFSKLMKQDKTSYDFLVKYRLD